jgi:glucose/arabinose dehydrogenase
MKNRYLKAIAGSVMILLMSGGCNNNSNQPLSTALVGFSPLFDTAFNQPVALVPHPTDDTVWFVIEKTGAVLMMDTDSLGSGASTAIDLTLTVDDAGEGGLLDMTFHPSFTDSGLVYLSFTTPGTPLTSNVSAFRMDTTGVIDPGSGELILTLDQPEDNHNGGCLVFGPDGHLYIGLGDGGGRGDPLENGQDTTTLFGTILRIDVDSGSPYTIPAGNFFAGSSTDRPEIYAWGLRNPWRFSFDSQEDTLWVGDVGQRSWEEIDIVNLGENYGWNLKEGMHCYSVDPCNTPGLTDPVVEYGREEGHSVTGGFVYRGLELDQLTGSYLFGDYVTGRLWSVDSSAPAGTRTLLADTNLNIVSFSQAPDGELYIVDFGGGVYKIVPLP